MRKLTALVLLLCTMALQASLTKVKYVEYTIEPGDTLYIVAKKHHTTVKEVLKANDLEYNAIIRVGQKLTVPTNTYSTDKDKKTTKPPKKGKTEYVIEPGDTLYTIAKKHNTSVNEVLEANGLEYDVMIKVGQKLTVPTNTYFPDKKKEKSDEPEEGLVEYTIEPGDTLYIIAKKYRTTVKEVREANELEYDAVIRVGQTLSVPTNTYFPEKEKAVTKEKIVEALKKGKTEYTIEPGDTFYTIAKKHHTTVKELLEANSLEYDAMIRIGQKLTVPTNTYFPDKDRKAVAEEKPEKKIPEGMYEIQWGDTLFSIARKNQITLKELMGLNKMKTEDINNIKIGQQIRIAKKKAYIVKKPEKKATVVKYTVKNGDTLSKIAKRNKISVKQLRKINKLTRKSRIKKGTVLVISVPSENVDTYRVKRGDTLWKIAKRYKMKLKAIRKLNKMSRKDRIKTGMVLAVNKVTAVEPKKIKAKVYRVDKGDTHTYVAKKKPGKKTKPTKESTGAMAALTGKKGTRNYATRGGAKVIRTAKKYLGVRYVWGAEGPNKFDCSGFTQYVMRKTKGVKIPRVSRKQAYYGKYVSRSNLRPGDLIFFDTSRRRRGYVNHVGIYIGNNKFIHASSGYHRVVITSLNKPFYKARFKWGRRVN